ncbi:MAG: flotillin-like FloA family protein [Planctomycetota bacterium]|jgi:uncharacterized protein YqfA (UPF0365 family)
MAIDPVLLVVVIVFAAVILLSLLSYFSLWFQAYKSGANISMVDLIGMTFRKVDRKTIVQAKIIAVRGGLEVDDDPMSFNDTAISTKKLESHYLAGGNVPKVISALIAAKRGNVDLSFPQACAIDLSGRDVLEEVRHRVASDGPVP